MTEAEWLACTDPTPMLEFIRGKASDRKMRLLGCAVCRQYWDRFSENRSRQTVEVAERYADGLATEEGLLAAVEKTLQWGDLIANQDFEGVAFARVAADVGRNPLKTLPWSSPAMLREVFGNPFRPLALDPSWLTRNNATILKLAQAIYDQRTFDQMPFLAVALEKAGCNNNEILNHCRGPGPHVRGCWALDLILGRSRS
jgi:hypothetical protein